MAERPFFVPRFDKVGVDIKTSASFEWNRGFSISQKKKNVHALHDAICRSRCPQSCPLEVSSKSDDEVGVQLSAFNLTLTMGGKACTVESVFQASKVFGSGIGPFHDLYGAPPDEVRAKVKAIGGISLVEFNENGVVWPLNPTRAFYDWIYCRALHEHRDLVGKLSGYDSFTDIEFNPERSINCQAYAVALYLSMSAAGVLEEALRDKNAFLRHHPGDEPACAATSGFARYPGATRYSTIVGLMDSTTNRKWNLFLREGPYWNYLVSFIKRTNIFRGRDDRVEEAVMNACEKIGRFLIDKRFAYPREGEGLFRAFLKRVAARTALNLLQEISRQEQIRDTTPHVVQKRDLDEMREVLENVYAEDRRTDGNASDSPTDDDLDAYDVKAGLKRDLASAQREGTSHTIVSLDDNPFPDDGKMPDNYDLASLFDFELQVSKEDLAWVQKLQLHVLLIALGHVLSNKKVSTDRRELLRLRYGMDMKTAEIYKQPRFASKSRNAVDAQMSHAKDFLREEVKSWWELVKPEKNVFADEKVLKLWRDLARSVEDPSLARRLQDKANSVVGRIG